MSSSAKSFLSTLKDLNDANTVTVKVPSLGKSVTFKQISVSQQKELLKTAFDGVDGVITRATAINKIITDNCVDDVEFLIIDKPAIMIALRIESIGSKIKIDKQEYDLKDITPLKKSDVKLKHKVEYDGITVNLKIPNLTVDTDVSNKLAKEFAKFETPEEKVKHSLDIVVAFESAKYVDKISIGDESITFDEISVHERQDIINNLPLALSTKIINYIGGVKDATDKAMSVADEVVVEFDAGFLSGD